VEYTFTYANRSRRKERIGRGEVARRGEAIVHARSRHVLENRYSEGGDAAAEFAGEFFHIYKPTARNSLSHGGRRALRHQGRHCYYEWMMVSGGIFPTIWIAEHGKDVG